MGTIFDKTSTSNSDSNSVLFQTLLEHERKLQELENQNSAFENTNKYLRDEILDLQWTCLQFRYITEKFEKYSYDPDDVLEKQRKNKHHFDLENGDLTDLFPIKRKEKKSNNWQIDRLKVSKTICLISRWDFGIWKFRKNLLQKFFKSQRNLSNKIQCADNKAFQFSN